MGFFLFEFFLRVVPATISEYIIRDLSINPQEFAVISAAYYVTYSLMQTPVGILLDRYGTRLLLSVSCLICTVGIVGFAFAANFYSCVIARFLIGFGSSFGFIGLLVTAINWFPQRYFGFVSGLGQFLGAIGPLAAGVPIALLIQSMNGDWRKIFLYSALYGIILSGLLIVFMRRAKDPNRDEIIYIERPKPLKTQLKQLLKIKQVWWILLYAGFNYVSVPLMGAYWGTLYLQTRGLDKPMAASVISLMWIGMAIGCPLVGRLSDYCLRRKPFLVVLSLLGAFVSLGIVILPGNNHFLLGGLFFLLGLSASGQTLSYAAIADNVPQELRATGFGFNNTAIMALAAILPTLFTISIQWQMGERTTYLQGDFTLSFLLMPVIFFLSFLFALTGVQETFCRQRYRIHSLSVPSEDPEDHPRVQ